MNLDNTTDFNRAVTQALFIGQSHVAACHSRIKSDALIALLGNRLGQFAYRRFHVEILNRAYGLPFINAAKVRQVKKLALKHQ